jgi:chitodextrinase
MTHGRQILVAIAVLATLVVVGIPAAQAQPVVHDRVVSDDPANYTPDIMDGSAEAVIQIGDKVIVGGTFSTVQAAGSNVNVTRTRLMAFNAMTGAIDTDFAPAVNGDVLSFAPGPGGDTVYVGGAFTTVGGRAARRLALLDVDSGAHVPGFAVPTINGLVKDMEVSGGRLYLAGSFSSVGSVTRTALAALNPTTGGLLADFNPVIGGTHDGRYQGVVKIAVSPNGERMAVIGGFGTVNGARREQIAMLDLTTTPASLANWYTPRYEATCFFVFYTYMRDVAFSPDSSYLVIGTTGRHYAGTLCDAVARFETYATGTNLRETWLDYTGGDSVISVTATRAAVYAGGHFRWWNNPFCPGRGEAPCAGAVARDGIVALDPANGLPLAWNPGRARGYGIYQFLPTAQGMWAVSDTATIGGEQHGRIAFLPLAGGTVLPPQRTGTLPGQVFTAGAAGVRHRTFDGTAAGPPAAADAGGVDWSASRGAFMINDILYAGWSDGRFLKRTFDGAAFGPPAVIDTADRIVPDTAWHNTVPAIAGMFFASGRLYYTKTGTSSLFYRYFTADSDVVGATEFVATGNVAGIDWSVVGGMFLVGDALYFVTTTDGRLHRATWAGTAPVAGSATTVGTAIDWNARAVFLSTAGAPPNTPPVAAFAPTCAELTCTFDAAASADPDGSIASYAWTFGDGGTATGVAPAHTYAAAGGYDATLTVTDSQGATTSVTRAITVAGPPPAPTPTPPARR